MNQRQNRIQTFSILYLGIANRYSPHCHISSTALPRAFDRYTYIDTPVYFIICHLSRLALVTHWRQYNVILYKTLALFFIQIPNHIIIATQIRLARFPHLSLCPIILISSFFWLSPPKEEKIKEVHPDSLCHVISTIPYKH